MILALRGTSFIYYGEEIGMRDAEIPAARKRDPVGRDGCRSPMQWSGARNGGFSASARTWLPCGDFKAVNVARQLNDPHSMLSLYRRLIYFSQINAGAGRGQLSRRGQRARRLSRVPSRYARTAPGRRAEFHGRATQDRSARRQNPAEHDRRSPGRVHEISPDARGKRRLLWKPVELSGSRAATSVDGISPDPACGREGNWLSSLTWRLQRA